MVYVVFFFGVKFSVVGGIVMLFVVFLIMMCVLGLWFRFLVMVSCVRI